MDQNLFWHYILEKGAQYARSANDCAEYSIGGIKEGQRRLTRDCLQKSSEPDKHTNQILSEMFTS